MIYTKILGLVRSYEKKVPHRNLWMDFFVDHFLVHDIPWLVSIFTG